MFFFGLLHVFIFLLNNYIVLGYITTHDHPRSCKRGTGLILSVLCTRNSHHITATATNRVMTKPPPQLEPQPLISATTSHVIGMFFFLPFTSFFILNNYIVLGYVTTHDHPRLLANAMWG